MADKFNVKAIIEQMEVRYKDLAGKLEGFQIIQEEMTTLSRAIKVMKGEKLTPGGPKGPRKSKQEWASRIMTNAAEDNGNGPSAPVSAREAAYAYLKSTPKGATIKQISDALSSQGIEITNQRVHNALRAFFHELKVVGVDTTSRGQHAKIYAFKKGD